jgi:hypothetical protein
MSRGWRVHVYARLAALLIRLPPCCSLTRSAGLGGGAGAGLGPSAHHPLEYAVRGSDERGAPSLLQASASVISAVHGQSSAVVPGAWLAVIGCCVIV